MQILAYLNLLSCMRSLYSKGIVFVNVVHIATMFMLENVVLRSSTTKQEYLFTQL